MSRLTQLTEYDFHDSLLEEISCDNNKRVFLKIDFCNWKQEGYDDSKEETSIISIVFNDVSSVVIPKFELNSDEIIKFEVFENGCVKIIVFNDMSNSTYEIIIHAKSVEIIK